MESVGFRAQPLLRGGACFSTLFQGQAMDSEQEITLGAWAEMESELAEVRKKRDQLDAMNLRVTDNLRRTIEEREQAAANAAVLREQVAELDVSLLEMTAQRDTMERYRDQMRLSRDEARKATAAAEQDLLRMTAERDAAKETNGSQSRMIEALQRDVSDLEVQLSQWQVGHDAIREQLTQSKEAADMFEEENKSLRDAICQLRAKQIHDDLPGILMVIQLAAEQARELI